MVTCELHLYCRKLNFNITEEKKMKDLGLSIKAGGTAIIATLAHIDWFFIYMYVIFMILDLLTGWYKATKNR